MKLVVLFGSIVLVSLIGFALAFNEPTANPPNDNVAAPLNVGGGRQTKVGDITLNNMVATSITLGGETRFAWPSPYSPAPDKLWGQGRPDAGVIDAGGECVVGGFKVSRSDRIVTWDGAPAACPAGWWVCSKNERGSGICKISGWGDDAAGRLRYVNCDTTEDAGTYQDSDGGYTESFTHSAWVSNAAIGTGSNRLRGIAVNAANGSAGPQNNCTIMSVWCCAYQ